MSRKGRKWRETSGVGYCAAELHSMEGAGIGKQMVMAVASFVTVRMPGTQRVLAWFRICVHIL